MFSPREEQSATQSVPQRQIFRSVEQFTTQSVPQRLILSREEQ